MTRRTLLSGAAALALGATAAMAARPARAGNSLHLGEPAPPATLVTLDGEPISTTSLRGRVVILTFWATWCVPCREELPLLSDYAQAHAAQGLTVLAFCLDEPENLPRVRQIARSFHFPSGLLAQSNTKGYGRIWHIPVNFTIDRTGLLADDGWKDKRPVWTAERLDRIVTPLLISAG
ncbi:MAG TPA: TlpA disulfide reductase family protein [Steroidobacteraceae bacterium]|jgi:cytochrome c biogenesis protein CcmG/thiol:disulfide interchange protein DsbE|nr:TlpA disulfide reductase family protein [Steroidobacteraceae bacterium]